nr:CHAT domain-containing protein [Leptolyngbya sp. FACHB-711]
MTCYQQALVISQADQLRSNEANALYNLGLLYANLGQLARALEFYQQALVILREIGDLIGEATTLLNMGYSYDLLGEYVEAENLYQQSLTVANTANDRISQAYALNNLGYLSYRSKQFELSLALLRQALLLFEEIGGQVGEIYTLDSLGQVHVGLKQFDRAWEFYQQALVVATAIGDRASNRLTLSNMGSLLVQQNQPELAIVFYKRSVNITEEIRRGIQGLPIEQQQFYTNTIADTYRKLAALLIQQDRILEAQQVLDLLKVQEIQDYLRRGVRGTEQTLQGVYLWEAEQRVFASFETLLQQGRRLAELEAIPPEDLTPEQRAELIELDQKSRQIQATFNRFVDLPDVQAALQRLRLNARQVFDLDNLDQLGSNLEQLRPDAVLLYPLVLDDRLELVILSPNLEPLHKTVDVTRVELNQTISDFLRDLQNHESDPKPNAAKLYNWLIRPIESFLHESGAKVIIYAPDRQLRYIPLAALHNGQQWFVENYQINQITAVSLTNLNTPPRPNPRILAGAYSEGRHLIARRSGESPIPFRGLPFAGVEVQTIASLFPETRQLINQEFTEASTLPFLNSYNIVHFATHAIFTTGSPEDSFIVMGNGDTIDLSEIRTLRLRNVDLMVLSGCQTAVSTLNMGQELGEGIEILGFGYEVQNSGARATIASLWSVDDGGTEVLMSQFYALLQQANRSKAETLQQAQIALIRGQGNLQLENALIRERNAGNLPEISAQQLTHPYYWAPFILIGNGL